MLLVGSCSTTFDDAFSSEVSGDMLQTGEDCSVSVSMASYVLAMASNLIAMASNLVAMPKKSEMCCIEGGSHDQPMVVTEA